MYEIITLIVVAITAITTASVKAAKNAKERNRQTAWTVDRFRQQGLTTQQAQFNTVKKGFVAPSVLIETAQLNLIADNLQRERIKKDREEFNKLLWMIGITAAFLIVAVIILKPKAQ
jgi:hypothetical protein